MTRELSDDTSYSGILSKYDRYGSSILDIMYKTV